jgi:hypothetical protein
MFDIEKEEMQEATVEQETPNWETADWEQITHDHAENGDGFSSERIYRKTHAKHKQRTGIAAARYAMLAIGLTAIGWAVRDMEKLAITLGVIALVFGLVAAFGAGKYREM